MPDAVLSIRQSLTANGPLSASGDAVKPRVFGDGVGQGCLMGSQCDDGLEKIR